MGGIVTGCTRHPPTWVRARAAQVQAFEWHPVIGGANHRPGAEELVQSHLSVEDIAADKAETPLQIER